MIKEERREGEKYSRKGEREKKKRKEREKE